MTLTRKELLEEERRMKRLKKKGWTWDGPANSNLKSWLHGWRQVGNRRKHD